MFCSDSYDLVIVRIKFYVYNIVKENQESGEYSYTSGVVILLRIRIRQKDIKKAIKIDLL